MARTPPEPDKKATEWIEIAIAEWSANSDNQFDVRIEIATEVLRRLQFTLKGLEIPKTRAEEILNTLIFLADDMAKDGKSAKSAIGYFVLECIVSEFIH